MTGDRHITPWEWRTIDAVLMMDSSNPRGKGYLLDFSDRTLADFFEPYRVDLNDERFRARGTSKANRLRAFILLGPIPLVGQILGVLLDHRLRLNPTLPTDVAAEYRGVAARLGGRGTSGTYDVPIARLSVPSAAPEPTLAFAEYDHILAVCRSMADVMERDPRAYAGMGEEHLRSQFLAQLNGHYPGGATGETFNYLGKTDILLRSVERVIFVAECKIWRGAESFTATIDQLLGYTAWRDTRTAILIFSRNKDTTAVLAQIPGLLQTHPNYIRSEGYGTETGFRCHFRHRDDAGRHLVLTVLVFDVPR